MASRNNPEHFPAHIPFRRFDSAPHLHLIRNTLRICAAGVLLVLSGCVAPPRAGSSSLDSATGLRLARALCAGHPGWRVFTVLPTGSMRPTLDERTILVVEPVGAGDLRVGDVTVYGAQRMVHRVELRRGDGWFIPAGDFNRRSDGWVDPRQAHWRVVALIYTQGMEVAVK